MEYTTLPLSALREWDRNKRAIKRENFLLLKEKLEKKKQFKPLFVTPNGDDTYTVLAGNMRLRAYKELGAEELWVTVLTFIQKADELWYVEKDGQLESERFTSKEDAMLDWSMSENEDFGYYDMDKVANEMDGYNLDWTKYIMSDKSHRKVSTKLNDYLMQDKMEKKPKEHTCPHCGNVFTEGR